MFKKKALTTAVQAAMVVSAATLMQGCNLAEEKSTSKISGIFEQVRAPKGTVIGSVTDTNGNPLEGVEVYIGSKKTKTNAGGQYQFNNVAVNSTVSTTGLGALTNVIEVTIVAPAGYLGATVTVLPQAQLEGMDGDGGDPTGDQVSVFIDGYTASAGSASLPQLNASVTGTLRNGNTGEAITNTLVSFDMLAGGTGGTVAQEAANNSPAGVRYATGNYTATTDANGQFTMTGLPADSTLALSASGYTAAQIGDANDVGNENGDVNGGGANGTLLNIDTRHEGIVLNLNDIIAFPLISMDNTGPYLSEVSHVARIVAAGASILERGFDGTQGFTLTFSEELGDTFDGDIRVIVYDVANGVYIPVTNGGYGSVADNTVTFATESPITANSTDVRIYLPAADLNDVHGNDLILGGAGLPNEWLGNDGVGTLVGTSEVYLQIPLRMFIDDNTSAQAVASITQLGVDALAANPNLDFVALGLEAFSDVDHTNAALTIDQLNSQKNGSEAAGRLDALVDAITGNNFTVNDNVARVQFSTTNASTYQIGITTSAGANANTAGVVTVVDPENNVDGGVLATVGGFGITTLTPADPDQSVSVELVLTNQAPGNIITITPFDDLGNPGTPTSRQLVDNVSPTTIIQTSYNNGSALGNSSTGYGDGGELAAAATLSGVPNLNVNYNLLDNIDKDDTTDISDNNLNDELVDYNTIDPTTGSAYIADTNTYDAYAYTQFANALSRTVGIAISEDVVATGGALSYDGTNGVISTAASSFVVRNDVTFSDDANGVSNVNVDLVNIAVANVFDLAADHGSELDLSAAIEDVAGNPATDAKVNIVDRLQPMIRTATYNGETLVITFNEAVVIKPGDTVNVDGVDVAINSVDRLAHNNKTADKNILTLNYGESLGDLTQSPNLPTYAENGETTAYRHGTLDADPIEDIYGNAEGAANMSPDGVLLPNFAYKDLVGNMNGNVTVTVQGRWNLTTAQAGDIISVTYTSPHRISLSNFAGVGGFTVDTTTGDTILGGTDVANNWDITVNGNLNNVGVDIDNLSGSLSASGKVLRIQFELINVPVAGDDINLNNNAPDNRLLSAYNADFACGDAVGACAGTEDTNLNGPGLTANSNDNDLEL